jgi:PKD domain
MRRGTWVAIAVVALVIASPFVLTARSPSGNTVDASPFVLTAPSPSGNTVDALMEDRTQITERPVAQLPIDAYEAGIGEEITFDASDSYGVSAEIATYDWDFDGDGVFDARTTSPVIDHTYTAAFDGSMQVRVTDTDGGLGSVSVPVRIGQPAPVVPAAPTVTVAATGTEGEVTLSWSGSGASKWVISVNDFPLGYTTDNPVTITDIPRDRDVTFTVTPIGDDGTSGEPGTATLAAAPA